ncbi:MAG: GspH/FimT family pseudopilin [Collimonas sp.]|uniref:GspH/FimT family pseudopilin n=1 Tax=Collimonas sp. TaxID=1963772 RepID=UPI003266474B
MKSVVVRHGVLVGFTLVEMLVTITVAAILLAIAIPSFTSMLMNNRLSTQVSVLSGVMQYARSSALTQNINVQVCPFSTTGSITCGANWNSGWIVATKPAAGTGTLLKSYPVSSNAPTLSSATSTVLFDTRGLAVTQANFKFCDNRGASFARSLQVALTGSVILGPTPGTAIWGGALSCP